MNLVQGRLRLAERPMGSVQLLCGSFLDHPTAFEWMKEADIIFINNGSFCGYRMLYYPYFLNLISPILPHLSNRKARPASCQEGQARCIHCLRGYIGWGSRRVNST